MRVVVLGAGSWGTTVASLLAGRHPTLLWARDPDVADEINQQRTNTRYLPDCLLPATLEATADLDKAVGRGRAARRRRAVPRVPRHPRGGPAPHPPVDPGRQPEQGPRAGLAPAHDRGHQGGAARPSGRRAVGAEHRQGDHGRPGGGQRHRHRGPGRRRGAAAGPAAGAAAGLHQRRRHRLRAGRGTEERRGPRLRAGPGPVGRRQHPRRRDDPGPGRAHPPRRGHGRPPVDLRRPGRDGRPGGHVHQPLQPQPARRRAARRGQAAARRSWPA